MLFTKKISGKIDRKGGVYVLDIIIHNATVITMAGKGTGVRENFAVGIKGDTISCVGDTHDVLKRFKAHRYINGSKKIVMPGLIDCHIHTSMALYRGVAQDTAAWLQRGIVPFAKHMSESDATIGSLLNIVEGIKSGTTTFCDYDYPMDVIAENYKKVGVRARLATLINELPDNIDELELGELYPFDPAKGEKRLKDNVRLLEEWNGKDNGRITCMLGPQGPDMLSKELLLEIKNLAEKYDVMLHMHVAQGDREINQMTKRYGKRSVEYLDELNLLNRRLLAVHLTEATSEEAQLVAKRGVSMVYCAGSIGIIDGIVPPVAEFIAAGGIAGLGSDQAPGNNCNNMFNEMKFAAILNKVKFKDPTVFPAWKVLRMATIEAAEAIGLGKEIGSIEPGKKADIIILDLMNPNLCPFLSHPIRNIVPNLVYSARGHEVETVIVNGQVIMEDRKILTVDEDEILLKASEAAKNLAERAAQSVKDSGTNTVSMMEEGYL